MFRHFGSCSTTILSPSHHHTAYPQQKPIQPADQQTCLARDMCDKSFKMSNLVLYYPELSIWYDVFTFMNIEAIGLLREYQEPNVLFESPLMTEERIQGQGLIYIL